LKNQDAAITAISPTADREVTNALIVQLDKISEEIKKLNIERNKALVRKKKNERVLSELRSLNRTVDEGKLMCLDCKSESIGYRMKESETVFDVTTADIRQQIFASVDSKIKAYADDVEVIEVSLRSRQRELSELMAQKEVSLIDIVAYKEDYEQIKDYDYQISEISAEITKIDGKLSTASDAKKSNHEERKLFDTSLLATMNEAYRQISQNLGSPYAGLFTTQNTKFSGSEATEYFIARTYALAKALKHDCPIVIDSFRAEDLSTSREDSAIRLLENLSNQIIMTTTIKDEEHDKYASYSKIDAIDYTDHESYKLLTEEHTAEFLSELEQFGVVA
jgi:hypothetical protein